MIRSIFTMALLLSAAACGSDGPTDLDDDDLAPGSMGTLSARIDGSTWNATTTVGATHLNGVFGFGATDGTGRAIIVVVEASPGPGAQAIRVSTGTNLTFSISEANGTVWTAGSLGSGAAQHRFVYVDRRER